MGLQQAGGISSRKDCSPSSGDKDEHNLRFSPCQVQVTILWAEGTA